MKSIARTKRKQGSPVDVPYNIGVHQAHCCARHGCKYGDNPCPVEHGGAVQDYPCYYCSSVDEARHGIWLALGSVKEAIAELRWARRVEKIRKKTREAE